MEKKKKNWKIWKKQWEEMEIQVVLTWGSTNCTRTILTKYKQKGLSFLKQIYYLLKENFMNSAHWDKLHFKNRSGENTWGGSS